MRATQDFNFSQTMFAAVRGNCAKTNCLNEIEHVVGGVFIAIEVLDIDALLLSGRPFQGDWIRKRRRTCFFQSFMTPACVIIKKHSPLVVIG